MSKSLLISLQWLPHSPPPSTLNTDLPFCEQSKKNSQKKRKRRKGVFVGIAQIPSAEGKVDCAFSCWRMKNPESFGFCRMVSLAHLKGRKLLFDCLQELSRAPMSSLLFSLWVVEPQGLWQKSPQCPISWPNTCVPRAPHLSHAQKSGTAPCFSAKRHHLCEWQGLAAPLVFLS